MKPRLVDRGIPVGTMLDLDGLVVKVTHSDGRSYTCRPATKWERRRWKLRRAFHALIVVYLMPRGPVRDLLIAAHKLED